MKIKNWKKFQHFSDRRPIWIKLYRDLLDDIEWHDLDPLAAKTLVALWLIASENEGLLPSAKVLAFRLRMPEKSVLSIISKLGHWLEQGDIEPISDVYHNDALEKRREEKEKRQNGADAPVMQELLKVLDPTHAKELIEHRRRKGASLYKTSAEKLVKKLAAYKNPNAGVDAMIANGWQGFEPEWMKSRSGKSQGPPVACDVAGRPLKQL
jgi:hypothetical protein